MSFFENVAGDVFIYGGTFQKAETINNYYDLGRRTADPALLYTHVVTGAMHDSSDRYDPPKCHPETRTAVLDLISGWLSDPDTTTEPVLWLSGPAGAGKSAIMQTLAERFHDCGLLGASWFFSRTVPGRNEKRSLAATLAYQLVGCIGPSEQGSAIFRAVSRDPKIFEKSFRTQIQKLVVEPCLEFGLSPCVGPKGIIIDGLDECVKEEEQRDILETITYFAAQHPDLPLRWLIASRPERQIRETFALNILNRLTKRVVLDQTYNPNADIFLFLTCRFAVIRSKHSHLPASWPTAEAINKLVQKSSGQFIYAATVIRFIDSPRGDPVRNLEIILRLAATRRNENPYAELDALYTYILDAVTEESRPIIMNIISKIIYINDASPTPSLPFYDKPWSNSSNSPGRLAWLLFNDEPHEIYRHLIDMHSLLEIPPQDRPDSASITIIHASFSDFLADSTRSGKYYTTRSDAAVYYVSNLLKHLMIHLAGPPHQSVYLLTPFHFKTCIRRTLYTWIDECKRSPGLKLALQIMLNGTDEEYFEYLQSIGMEKLGPTRRCNLADLLEDYQSEALRSYIKTVEEYELKGPQTGSLKISGSHSRCMAQVGRKRTVRTNAPYEPGLADIVPILLSIATGVPMTVGRTA